MRDCKVTVCWRVESTTDNVVVGTVELKEEGLPWVQCLEQMAAAWLPEIDLIDAWDL